MKTDIGVTLVELLVVIFVIGIFVAFFVPAVLNRSVNNARITATRTELNQIRTAIIGDPDINSGGQYAAAGFKNDVGRMPNHLIELVRRVPDTLGLDTMPIWNPFTRHGWNGPYMRDDGKYGFMYDAWGESYRFITNDNGDILGLASRGLDGEWYVQGLANDDIEVLF